MRQPLGERLRQPSLANLSLRLLDGIGDAVERRADARLEQEECRTCVAVGLLTTHGGDGNEAQPPRPGTFAPAPVRPGASPAAEARNLAAWLRRYSARK